jgi:hypothetical protein
MTIVLLRLVSGKNALYLKVEKHPIIMLNCVRIIQNRKLFLQQHLKLPIIIFIK